MNFPRNSVLVLLVLFASAHGRAEDFFQYDSSDETVQVAILENPLFYDAGIASATNGLWIAWLEFQPGKGDQLWLGLRDGDKWISKTQISQKPGDYANPTPTIDAKGKLWLTYESTNAGDWNVFVQRQKENGRLSEPQQISSGTHSDIHHTIAVNPKGGIWIVWQSDQNGQFDILARHVSESGISEETIVVDSIRNDWHPSATVTPDGTLHVIWDQYDGKSYNVLERSYRENQWSEILTIASGPAFQAHAQIASDKRGKLFVLWEEDGENWGKHYLSRTPGDKKSTKMTDNLGPLHRFRKLHFAELDEKKRELKEFELPMPSFALAQNRTNAPAGLKNYGAFYERGQLVVDAQNVPWILYRHFYTPSVGIVPETHKQDSSRLYARYFLTNTWSKLFSLSEGQGDGLQRIFVTPQTNGIAVAFTTGRTDRRESKKPRGVALAEIKSQNASSKTPAKAKTISLAGEQKKTEPRKRLRPEFDLAEKRYQLFFGDLHRHTDISLCFSPSDGTIDDAYRYAIDTAPLDFLGITDHTHDLDQGEQLSLIWWRSRKEVNRHQLAETFFPFFSYERSRADTDHNVISLRDDVLRPHTYPLTEFWKELDTNTFTIPHQPFNRILWNYKNDAHRPLLEIYQGFRNTSAEADAKEGLLRGHRFGVIAASDHLSTGGSFACVWVDKMDREGIFRAMQARRTYGATSKINLRVTCGEHWMGESLETKEMPPIKVELERSAPISNVDLYVDGVLKTGLTDIFQSKDGDFKYEFASDKSLAGEHIFYVHIKLVDGNRAWSSPIWVNVKNN